MTTDKQNTVLNEKELAEMLGMSSWTIRRARLEENMPHFTIGKRIFYRLETILQWIAAKESGGGTAEETVVVGKLRVIK